MIVQCLQRVLRALALVVPLGGRARWQEEWLAEIQHVARDRGLRTAMRVALGALPDAFAFRRVTVAGPTLRTAHTQSARRGFMNSSINWLDFKLGVRMLIKFPGLSFVAALGISVAIAIGAGTFTFFYSYMNPALPLDEGERVIAIENWDAAASRREDRSLHDFVTWRDELKSIEDVGAYREIARNLLTEDGVSERVRVAEMTAAGFKLARVSPIAGRPLVEGDERRGAPPVIVIGYDAWRTRFASDPGVVGRTVRLGSIVHTIVGVMPEGFAFPVYHGFWVPLQADAADYERRQGPAIHVFGRLAAGVSRDAAQAELTTIGLQAAAAFPATHERLRPRLAPYTSLWFGGEMVPWHLHTMQFLVTMLLVVVCVNVASLVYARTAMRYGEIAVRSALGGSRGRIVAQLFVEALVLSSVAAAVGLVLADRALAFVNAFLEQMGGAPFWMGDGLSLGAVLYVGGLAVLGAAIVGAVPALKATGRRLEPGLRQLGGGTGLQLGKTWTALIVAQVALAVAVMPAAFSMGWQAIGYRAFEPGFAAGQYVTARLSMDRDTPPTAEAEAYQGAFAARFGQRVEEVVRQLEAEPGVIDVTFSSRLPGDEPTARIEIDGETPPATSEPGDATTAGSRSGIAVRFGFVGMDFFDVFQIPLLAGRRFSSGDLGTAAPRTVDVPRVPTISGKLQQNAVAGSREARPAVRSTAVIVNRSFAQRIFGGGDALGRRVGYAGASSEPAGWYEIVGVVGDFPPSATELTSADARMYHPVTPEQIHPASVAARVRGNTPASLAGKLREITTAIDPTLQLAAVLSLDQVYREGQVAVRSAALAFGIVTLSVLLLSAAGIYALMSFTVAQRRREIGIRAALGADSRRLLAGIFSRALLQLAIGVVAGLAIAALIFEEITNSQVTSGHGAVIMPVVAVIMMTVGLLAAVGPARRGLRIDPTEALRGDS